MAETRTISSADVWQCIEAAVDEFNATRPPESQLPKTPETRLFGSQGQLDSLGLVHLIVALEACLAEELDVMVTLADERAMSRKSSPFRSLQTLADFVLELTGTASHV
jgi:acyl carrier protein